MKNGENTPLISVVIPVYNGVPFLKDAIGSVLNQTMQAFELVVADNCSTDGTFELASGFTDPRIRLIRFEEHLPIFASFNRAAGKARGRYLKFLCADDEFLPECLANLVEIHENQPGVSLVCSSRQVIDEKGAIQGIRMAHIEEGPHPGNRALELLAERRNLVGEPTSALVRKDVFSSVGGFDARFLQLGDFHLWCRLMTKGDLYYHSKPLSRIRTHSRQLSSQNMKYPGMTVEEMGWIREMFPVWGKQSGLTSHRVRRARMKLGSHLIGDLVVASRDKYISPWRAVVLAVRELGLAGLISSFGWGLVYEARRRRERRIEKQA